MDGDGCTSKRYTICLPDEGNLMSLRPFAVQPFFLLNHHPRRRRSNKPAALRPASSNASKMSSSKPEYRAFVATSLTLNASDLKIRLSTSNIRAVCSRSGSFAINSNNRVAGSLRPSHRSGKRHHSPHCMKELSVFILSGRDLPASIHAEITVRAHETK